MISEWIILGAVILVSLTSIYVVISRDWRYCIGALAVQYIGVFVLVYASWPIEMAVAKMVAGWMAGAILGIAMTSVTDTWRDSEKSIRPDFPDYGSINPRINHFFSGPSLRILAFND
jgi:hypothetical protein